MARRLGSTPFADLLPGSLSGDATVRAAAEALDSVLDATTRTIPTLLLYARLAHDTGFIEPVAMLPPLARLTESAGGPAPLPDDLLDHLAWQLHVENYETAVDTPAKRRLIAASLLLHRRRGTPWAVRTALETALRMPTAIRQWWEYEGRPYFFRVRLDVSGAGLDISCAENAIRIIFDQKNVRSWLDCLETVSTRRLPIAVATAGIMRTLNRVRLWFPPKPVPPARVHVATAGIMRTLSRVRLHFSPEPAAPARPRIAVTSLIRSRGRLRPFTPPRPVPAGRGYIALALLTMTRSRVCPQP